MEAQPFIKEMQEGQGFFYNLQPRIKMPTISSYRMDNQEVNLLCVLTDSLLSNFVDSAESFDPTRPIK